MKKEPKLIGVTHRPIIIVGEKMGRQRRGQDRYSLEGNGTGDFIHEAVGDKTNIILTNIVNHYYPGPFMHDYRAGEGVTELIELIEKYQPSKIITLGNIARDYVKSISVIPDDCPVVELRHPSWINRFHRKDRHIYLKILSDELDKRVCPNTLLGRSTRPL